MPRLPVVFISSTSDLAAEREALASTLPPAYAPYLYERDRARSRSPEDRCREMIEQSDVFVCLLGERFGSLYSFDVGPRSIVEWEFDTARERDHLELMTFQKEPLTNIDPGQQAFLDRVTRFRTGIWCKRFHSTSQLVQDVSQSLLLWLVEYWAQRKEKRSRDRGRVRWVLLGLTLLSLGVLIAAAIGHLVAAPGSGWDAFTRTSLLGATMAVGCLIVLGLAFELGGTT